MLYNNTESKLRALEGVGRIKEEFADVSKPLVESCLLEDMRSTIADQDAPSFRKHLWRILGVSLDMK